MALVLVKGIGLTPDFPYKIPSKAAGAGLGWQDFISYITQKTGEVLWGPQKQLCGEPRITKGSQFIGRMVSVNYWNEAGGEGVTTQ